MFWFVFFSIGDNCLSFRTCNEVEIGKNVLKLVLINTNIGTILSCHFSLQRTSLQWITRRMAMAQLTSNGHHTMDGEVKRTPYVHVWDFYLSHQNVTLSSLWRKTVVAWIVMSFDSWPEWILPNQLTKTEDSLFLISCLMILFWYLSHP